jgi:hypothetical protein
MHWHIVRILIGYALASLAAAAILVAFVYVPGDLGGLGTDLTGDRLSEAGLFALVVAPWIALFAAAPALAGITFAETNKIAGAMFYAAVGLASAAAGFFLQHTSETQGAPGVFQAYALIAFLTAGITGGLVYWAVAGRYAGKPKPAAPAKA